MARKIPIAGSLLALAILAVGLCAAPASLASSSTKGSKLRCPVVKRLHRGVVVNVRLVNERVRIANSKKAVTVDGVGRCTVVKRTIRYVVLRPRQRPKPTPTPTVTPTPTATPTANPTPTVTPTPVSGHPFLVMDQTRIDGIRARIAASHAPEAAAYREFITHWATPALSATPEVFAGPYRGVEDWNTVFDTLNRDGATARNLALAYAFSGEARYATKCREFLVAWARGNTPTTQQDADMNDIGYHQSFGAFSFAYAYDLTYNSTVYSAADRAAIAAYFTAFVDAIKTSNDKIANDWCVLNPQATATYPWDASKHYHRIDTYVGGDAALLGQAARLAMAAVIGYQSAVDGILNESSYVLNLTRMLQSALTPENMGDGVVGHPNPVPHVYIYATYTAGRGGMLDYMTYNTRACSVLVDMAENLGWAKAKVASAHTKLYASWSYFARFFGPNAETNPNPMDVVNTGANLPRFTLAFNEFGDQRFLDIVNSGDRSHYYEPQLLGPITLTHSLR